MILHPEVQAKVQAEIEAVVGPFRQPAITDESNMPYTKAVITEVHRISSFVPFAVPHCTTEDVELEGFHIPKGTSILFLLNRHGMYADQRGNKIRASIKIKFKRKFRVKFVHIKWSRVVIESSWKLNRIKSHCTFGLIRVEIEYLSHQKLTFEHFKIKMVIKSIKGNVKQNFTKKNVNWNFNLVKT